MLKTNSKKYLINIRTYLSSAIDGTDYGVETTTPAQKLAFLFETFDNEFNHKYNVKAYPNTQDRLAQWLAGLPSAISLPFYCYDIIELAKELQEVDTYTKKMEDRICKNYFNFMAYHLLKFNSDMAKQLEKYSQTLISEGKSLESETNKLISKTNKLISETNKLIKQ